jgi:hypothetical protein
MTKCSFGMAPATLNVLPLSRTTTGTPAANIMDNKPVANVVPFGPCQSLANPTVSAATAAAMGALTPMPCMPNTTAPWVPTAPTVLVGNKPTLTKSSVLVCMYGGAIQVNMPGQFTATVK